MRVLFELTAYKTDHAFTIRVALIGSKRWNDHQDNNKEETDNSKCNKDFDNGKTLSIRTMHNHYDFIIQWFAVGRYREFIR